MTYRKYSVILPSSPLPTWVLKPHSSAAWFSLAPRLFPNTCYPSWQCVTSPVARVCFISVPSAMEMALFLCDGAVLLKKKHFFHDQLMHGINMHKLPMGAEHRSKRWVLWGHREVACVAEGDCHIWKNYNWLVGLNPPFLSLPSSLPLPHPPEFKRQSSGILCAQWACEFENCPFCRLTL